MCFCLFLISPTPFLTKEIKQVNVTCNIHNFILRYETKVPSRRKPEKQHIVYQHIVYQHIVLSEDDEKLTHKEFKIHLIDNNERFTAPARNLSVTELHSEISFCLELVSDAEKSCKEMIKMSPAVSQIHGVFLLAHESLRTALDLGKSADVAIGTANMAIKDVGSVVPFPSGVQPKWFKNNHKPSATVSKDKDVVLPTGLVVAHEPQDQGGVEGAEGGGPQGEQIPGELAGIPDEELEGLEEVEDPAEDSKLNLFV